MNLSVQYNNEIIQFTVEYRKRKTMEIQILPPDRVLVVCPKGLSESRIKEVVSKKAKWITDKLDELRDLELLSEDRELKDRESFMFLGNNYPLYINVQKSLKKAKVELVNGQLYIITPTRDDILMKKALENWYREKAYKKISERIEYYKKILGKEPKMVKVKEQKKRWGSCTSKGNIYFNWRIIMAPADVIDYVVVHELCHLIHMNHSGMFWSLVESVLPHYKESRNWLKKYGVMLRI